MVLIHGTNILVDEFSTGRRNPYQKFVYFLTHCHSGSFSSSMIKFLSLHYLNSKMFRSYDRPESFLGLWNHLLLTDLKKDSPEQISKYQASGKRNISQTLILSSLYLRWPLILIRNTQFS